MGMAAFNQAYKTFGACVSAFTPVENQVQASAQATCTAQQADPNFAAAHGGKTFDQYYGTGKNGKNAFGNCVSVSPARTRRASRRPHESGTDLQGAPHDAR